MGQKTSKLLRDTGNNEDGTGLTVATSSPREQAHRCRAEGASGARPFDLQRFVDGCKQAAASMDPQTGVRRLMERALRDRAALAAALRELGEEDQRVVPLYTADDLSILRVQTPPHVSPIHNHLMWLMIAMIEGQEKHYLYRRQIDNSIELAHQVVIGPQTGVFSLSADAIHAVQTAPNRPLMALHVYGGNFFKRSSRSAWDPDTLQELPHHYERLSRICEKLGHDRFPSAHSQAGEGPTPTSSVH